MALKILMVGGRRCGKTSALASTFDMIKNGPIKNFFTVADETNYTEKMADGKVEKQDVLSDKTLELKDLLSEPTDNIFLVDQNPTGIKWTYKLKLMLPGEPRKSMHLEFTDVPGEWFTPGAGSKIDVESGRSYREVITELIAGTEQVPGADVFVIMVDTPNLMHPKESIASATNAITGIQDYLTHIQADGSEKLVILSPIKCEKWVKEGKMDEVIAKMLQMYNTMLTALRAYQGMNIAIIPIETAGNILFLEHSEPTILAGNPPRKCKKETDEYVRLGDGSIHFLKEKDKIDLDPQSRLTGKLLRPHSWFVVNPNPTSEKLYAPSNCDQLPLHIIQFMLNKLKKEKAKTQNGSILDKLFAILLGKIFGTISIADLETKLRQINDANLIKNGVDNISYI